MQAEEETWKLSRKSWELRNKINRWSTNESEGTLHTAHTCERINDPQMEIFPTLLKKVKILKTKRKGIEQNETRWTLEKILLDYREITEK